jgi:hypothetical protein
MHVHLRVRVRVRVRVRIRVRVRRLLSIRPMHVHLIWREVGFGSG